MEDIIHFVDFTGKSKMIQLPGAEKNSAVHKASQLKIANFEIDINPSELIFHIKTKMLQGKEVKIPFARYVGYTRPRHNKFIFDAFGCPAFNDAIFSEVQGKIVEIGILPINEDVTKIFRVRMYYELIP